MKLSMSISNLFHRPKGLQNPVIYALCAMFHTKFSTIGAKVTRPSASFSDAKLARLSVSTYSLILKNN